MKKHMNIPMNLSLLRCILAGATCLLTGFPALANVPLILNYQGRLTVEALPANGAAAFKFALSDAGTQASQVATGSVTVDSGKVVGVKLLTPGAGYLTPPEVTILDAAGEGSGAVASATIAGGKLTGLFLQAGGSGYSNEVMLQIAAPPANVTFQTFWSNDGTVGLANPAESVELNIVDGIYSVALGDPELMEPLTVAALNHPEVYLRVWVLPEGSADFVELLPRQRLQSVAYSVMAATVEDGAVGAAQLAEGAVTGDKIAVGAVGDEHLAPGSIDGSRIAAATLTGHHFAPASITGNAIAAGSIESIHLSNNAVDSAKLADGSVTAAKFAPGALLNHPDLQDLVNVPAGTSILLDEDADTTPYTQQGFVFAGNLASEDLWYKADQGDPVVGRQQHAMAWNGSELLVFGGLDADNTPLAAGQLYDPEANLWENTPAANAPAPAYGHTITAIGDVWCVWGGWESFPAGGARNTGAFFRPATREWAPFPAIPGTPAARALHTAIWTGSDFIVWGGLNAFGNAMSAGARYNPDADAWSHTSVQNVPSNRSEHSAVWTGKRMIIWGGRATNANGTLLNNGGIYDPATDSWQPISTVNAPAARVGHAAVWTGAYLMVWGGRGTHGLLNDGAIYHPPTDTWTPMGNANAPSPRSHFAAAWTETGLTIFGGVGAGFANFLADGFTYNLAGIWAPLTNVFSPAARAHAPGLWTGEEFLFVGGLGLEDDALVVHADGGSVRSNRWLPIGILPAESHYGLAAAGERLLVWSAEGVYLYEWETNRWYQSKNINSPALQDGYDLISIGQFVVFWGGPERNARYRHATDTWLPISDVGRPLAGTALLRKNEDIEEVLVVWATAVYRYWPASDTWLNFFTGGKTPAPGTDPDDFQPWYIENERGYSGWNDFILLVNQERPHYRLDMQSQQWFELDFTIVDGNGHGPKPYTDQRPRLSVAADRNRIYSFEGAGTYAFRERTSPDPDDLGIVVTATWPGLNFPRDEQLMRRHFSPGEFSSITSSYFPSAPYEGSNTGIYNFYREPIQNTVATWTGKEFIIYGGNAPSGGYRYDPVAGELSFLNVPPGFPIFNTSLNEPAKEVILWHRDRLFVTLNPRDLYIHEPGKTHALYVKP